ncbi:MAG TPA: hypothetical protein VMT00_16740 [Thermoanaerobaculia bacterium]|nr:hypothetical protein [Thermoanaerobaculia bacterium]
MRKLFILAAALLMVSSAFAASPALNAGRLFVQPDQTFLEGGPATTNNDDSCDIAVTPAATLLLPYFEVDPVSASTSAVNTIFTLTNTSRFPQIAHITIWTDRSYPVIDFNIWLTGYDVQGISLYDILNRGVIPPTGSETSPGILSADENPLHFSDDIEDGVCEALPGPIPESLRQSIVNALTVGTGYGSCTGPVGNSHAGLAIGYVTVDVAATCSQKLPTDPDFYTQEILFDNVLIGDYQRINPTSTTGNYAGGNPMVHIRAIPEGGVPGQFPTNLPYTFYDRYTSGTAGTQARRIDRRQPLPSVWAARYISQGAGGFGTRFAIWREGVVVGNTLACTGTAASSNPYVSNSAIPIHRIVRFDESENPSVLQGCRISPCPGEDVFTSPEASARSVGSANFPPDNASTDDLGGWMYLNLSNGSTTAALSNRGSSPNRRTQNWVTIQMTAEGRFGVDFDAAYLGNGCSPNPGGTATIGPLNNFNSF